MVISKLLIKQVGDLNFILNYISFYNNLDSLSKQNPLFDIGYFYFLWLIVVITIALVGFFGISFLFISQICYIYNDSSFLEKTKQHKIENYYCCFQVDNQKNNVITNFN